MVHKTVVQGPVMHTKQLGWGEGGGASLDFPRCSHHRQVNRVLRSSPATRHHLYLQEFTYHICFVLTAICKASGFLSFVSTLINLEQRTPVLSVRVVPVF
jgi:hypothetical protein